MELILFAVWCFAVAAAGGLVGLVLGNLRLPATLLAASSAAAGAGTNLAISAVAAATAATVHIRAGRVNWRLVAWMGPPSIAGAVAGGYLGGVISEAVLLTIIAVVLLYSAYELWDWQPRVPGEEVAPAEEDAPGEVVAPGETVAPGESVAPGERVGPGEEVASRAASPAGDAAPRSDSLDIRAAVASGAAIGVLGGIVGLILGSLRMPALLRFVGETPQRAVGTNLTVGLMVGVAGALAHIPNAAPDLDLVLVGAAASIPGALVGSRLTGRLSEPQLVRGIALVLIVTAVGCVAQAVV